MKKLLSFFAVAALACSVHAATQVAVVDMELVILAHPLTATNRVELLALQKEFIAERDKAEADLQKIMEQFRAAVDDVRNEALSDAKRKAARANAEDLQDRGATAEQNLRKLVEDRQRSLRRRELLLFDLVMADIKEKIAPLAKKLGADIVIDKSAERASAPVPVVLYNDATMDITDDLIKATGGDKQTALDSRAKAQKFIFGETPAED